MLSHQDYELLDFGDGRKLERFGQAVVERPCPTAETRQRGNAPLWPSADGRFVRRTRTEGEWSWRKQPPRPWQLDCGNFQLLLKPTEFGHLGVFPEQAANWTWISDSVRRAGKAMRVLNLFAHTGGATLAAAYGGAEVTHIDGAKNVVEWARRNAEASQLAEAPIRWITEDAAKFVRRELRRENYYDAVILDPPSYGHGPKGEAWKLASDLAPLLADCAELVRRRPAFFLLTCHTAGFGPAELEAMLADTLFGSCGEGVSATNLSLQTADGRRLPAGVAARWPGR